ncbi:hypothetical protein EI94DRAFT_1846187 [Lactarius quietus]|nr:hypothetical protein EI94DRAFT_1846187 [Lactarius quietus]
MERMSALVDFVYFTVVHTWHGISTIIENGHVMEVTLEVYSFDKECIAYGSSMYWPSDQKDPLPLLQRKNAARLSEEKNYLKTTTPANQPILMTHTHFCLTGQAQEVWQLTRARSQKKVELMKMASVLGILASEKVQKQELTAKIWEYLDANPATTDVALTPPETNSTSHQQVPSHNPPHPPLPPSILILVYLHRWQMHQIYAKLFSPYDTLVSLFFITDTPNRWTASNVARCVLPNLPQPNQPILHPNPDTSASQDIPRHPWNEKHLKTSCEDIARQCGVDLDELHSFAESPTVLHMLVELKAHLLKVDTMLQTNRLNEVLELPVFKTGLQDWLAISMVSPGIPAYVTGVTPCMMVMMLTHKLATRQDTSHTDQ